MDLFKTDIFRILTIRYWWQAPLLLSIYAQKFVFNKEAKVKNL